LKKCHIQL